MHASYVYKIDYPSTLLDIGREGCKETNVLRKNMNSSSFPTPAINK